MHKTFNCWYVTQIRKYPAWIILGHDGMLLDSQLVIHIVAIFDATLLKTAKMKTNRFFPKHPPFNNKSCFIKTSWEVSVLNRYCLCIT